MYHPAKLQVVVFIVRLPARMKEEERQEVKPSWNPATLIADRLKLSRRSVGNVISLLNQGATIPFIARYRKEMTENMEPETLREVAEVVEELK